MSDQLASGRRIRTFNVIDDFTKQCHAMPTRAGISGATSTQWQTYVAYTLSQKGVSVFVLADMAGHRSIQTTQRYVTVNDEMKRNAVELI